VIDEDDDADAPAGVSARVPASVAPSQRTADESEYLALLEFLSDGPGRGHENRDKGGFGERWIEVLAEAAGLGCAFERVERSIGELTFTYSRRIGVLKESKITAQVKTTAQHRRDRSGQISYALAASAYNRLVGPSMIPTYLFLVTTSQERDRWVTARDDRDELLHGVYYLSLKDEEETAAERKTVRVPAANRVTPRSLIKLCVDAAYERHAEMGIML